MGREEAMHLKRVMGERECDQNKNEIKKKTIKMDTYVYKIKHMFGHIIQK